MTEKKKVTHAQWQDAIRKARAFVQNYDKVRFKVVNLALDVCDTSHGGRKADAVFSLKRFAIAIEIDPKTLYEWVRIKRCVLDKLPKSIQNNPEKCKFDDFRETMRMVQDDTPANEVKSIYYEMTKRNPEVVKFTKYGKWIKTLVYNVQRPFLMKDIPIDLLNQYHQDITLILRLIEGEISLRKKFSDDDAANRERVRVKERGMRIKQGLEEIVKGESK